MNRTFGLLRESYRAVMSALDYFCLGIAIVTPSGTVVAENRELRRLLELKDGLHLSRTRRLECSSSSNNGELWQPSPKYLQPQRELAKKWNGCCSWTEEREAAVSCRGRPFARRHR